MSSELYRKYINIIDEHSQKTEVLTEGVIDTLTQKVKGIADKIPTNIKTQILGLVSKALGKDVSEITAADLTLANAKKVLAANQSMNEADKNAYMDYDDIERADLPGSEKANKIGAAKLGAVVGGVLAPMSQLLALDSGLAPVHGLTLGLGAAMGAIILGYLFSLTAGADRVPTGRVGPNPSHYDDKKRDPRLDQPPK